MPAAAPTVTTTASLDAPDRVAVTVETSLSSEIDDGDSPRLTVGRSSLSVSVSVTSVGFATLLPPVAVPETVTDLFGESTVLPFAVTVTRPVLVIWPAAMVSVRAVLRSKSAATAPVPGAAATVTVTASLDAPDRLAVTVETPLSSVIDAGDSPRLTVGRASSSVSVSVTVDGFDSRPCPPVTVPETVTDLSGESTALPFAVTVTKLVLVVEPAGIVSAFAVLRSKSAPTAPVPAAAATVTVTASPDLLDRVAVTVVLPADSEIEEGDRARVTVGVGSSSVLVTVTLSSSNPL